MTVDYSKNGGSSGRDEKWSNSISIRKVDPTVLANALDIRGLEKKETNCAS